MKKILIAILFLTYTLTSFAQSYEELAIKAMDLAEQKDYIGAEMTIKSALRKEPDNVGNSLLLVNLGTFQRNLGKLDEALISYNAAIARFPNPVFLLHNRAALFCEMNNLDNALIDYSTILIDHPKDIEAIYRKGLIFLSKGNLPQAESCFNDILKIDSENLLAKSGLAMILKRNQKWEDAEVAYTYLIYNNRASAELYFNRAECYLHMSKLARTQEDLAKAVELGYTESPLFVLRGQLRLAQYDKFSAREDFLKAKEMGADAKIIDDLLRLCK